MSSKRGRKRNDNLPPNRARDVQRAFRARRAAHLQALEHRVSELEEENTCLRQALNLPPANRAPLGKGPTGKDKPKSFDGESSSGMPFSPSRNSSSANSPASTRNSSLSPSAITATMPSRSMQVIDSGDWDQTLLMSEQQANLHSSSEPPYQLAPMSAPLPSKSLDYSQYTSSSSLSSSSRSNMTNGMYMGTQTNYPHPADRAMGSTYGTQAFVMRGDLRDEPRQPYPYSQSSYQSHDPSLHDQGSPSPSTVAPLHSHSHPHHEPRDSPLPYPPRRSLTDPQGFSIGQGFPHLPNPAQLQPHMRQNDLPRLQDVGGHIHSPHRPMYGTDGRINSIS